MAPKGEVKPKKAEKKEKPADGEKKKVKKELGSKEKKDKDLENKAAKEAKKEKDPTTKKNSSSKKEKEEASNQAPVPKPILKRQPIREPAQGKKVADDYLGDMDLPSSESESEDEAPSTRVDKKETIHMAQTTVREQKKLAEKERKLLEKSHQMKEAALRDDDNVFDVSYENQGDNTTDVVSATDIKVHNMTIRAKGKILLEHAHLSITAGRRYGLVGPNGKGKSTLLRMVARRQIPVPENLDVLLVEQEVVGTDDSALQAVVAADVELMELRQEEAEILARQEAEENGHGIANGETSAGATQEEDDDSDRLNEIYERMQEIGSSSAEARASKILHGLGFTEAMQRRRTMDFSGGWRMRISLARALYIQPTVLLLDEPTNHLDLRAVLWLEEYLQRWKKTLVVVSHDRDFLNMVTTDIIHLHDERLHPYRGNFAQFEEMYEQRRREVNKVAEKFEKQMKVAKKTGSKASQDKVNKNAKEAQKRRTKGMVGAAEEEAAPADVPRKWNDYTVHFEFPDPSEMSAASLIQLNEVSFKYPGRDDFGLQGLNIGIDMGSRVAIVGPNGAGKTTLMNLLAGDIQPTQGEFRKSHTLRVGRYAQHFVDALQMDENPVEYLLHKYPQSGLKPEQMRAQLGKFGLSGHHHLQPICKLSGGQKARVVFTSIHLANPHILLLDEPTNHLDMQSIDALADALEQFEGGVVVISHDSQLLSRVCDDAERSEVWLVEDGRVEKYDGYFQDYKDELMKEISDELDEEEVYQRPDANPVQ